MMNDILSFITDPNNRRTIIVFVYFILMIALLSFSRRALWLAVCKAAGTTADEAYSKIKSIRSANPSGSMNMANAEYERWFFRGSQNENKVRRLKLFYDLSIGSYFLSAFFAVLGLNFNANLLKIVNIGVVVMPIIAGLQLFLAVINLRFPKIADKVTDIYESVAYSKAVDIILGIICIVLAALTVLNVTVFSKKDKADKYDWSLIEARIVTRDAENEDYIYSYDYNIDGITYYGKFTSNKYMDIGDRLNVRYNPDNYEQSRLVHTASGNAEYAFCILAFVFLFLGLWVMGLLKPLFKKIEIFKQDEKQNL